MIRKATSSARSRREERRPGDIALAFEKYDALGNDFILIHDPPAPLTPAVVRWLCNRRQGVGADGLMSLTSRTGGATFELYNQDGSTAEFSGNGFRCAVASLARRKAGNGHIELFGASGRFQGRATPSGVDLDVDLADLGFKLHELEADAEAAPDLMRLHRELGPFHMFRLTIGNPHLVLLGSRPIAPETLDHWSLVLDSLRLKLGPDSRGLNLSVSWPDRSGVMHLATWERGVGRTPACASAAVAFFLARGLVSTDERTRIVMAGGELVVGWAPRPGQVVRISGEANRRISGEVLVPAELLPESQTPRTSQKRRSSR